MKNLSTLLLMAFGLLATSSCTITSPVMLERQTSVSTANALPFTLGVEDMEKKGSQKLTDISSVNMLGIFTMNARMPRRSETDYLNKSFANALRGEGLFEYVYATPFEASDVDVTLSIELKKYDIDNSIYGSIESHCGLIPVVGIFVLIGELATVVPKEHFHGGWDIVYTLKNRDGKTIKSYTDKQAFDDYVDMWQQPFATYTWYESEWRKLFDQSLSRLAGQIRADKKLILSKTN